MIAPYFSDSQVRLLLGDCRDVLPTLPDASVDALVCDPPYELRSGANGGFMGQAWDATGIAYDTAMWRQCWRVLKPGAHLLAFGAPRTYHRLAVAIEDAGFEIRDSIHWIYGNGFPKSLNAAKVIDAQLTQGSSRPEDLRRLRMGNEYTATGRGRINYDVPGGKTLDGPPPEVTSWHTADAARWSGWGTALKPAHEPIVVARKSQIGTVASNVLEYGTGAINVDACRVPVTDRQYVANAAGDRGHADNRTRQAGFKQGAGSAHDLGRWPTNLVFSHSPACDDGCAPGCPVADLDAQTGTLTSGANPTRRSSGKFRAAYGNFARERDCTPARGADSGGASRFFPVFRYEGKASASERPQLDDGTVHSTVKPRDLMRWLVRLVCPPGGTVLDPFAGSGTTLEACAIEGFHAIGIEKERPYADLCVKRLSKPIQAVLDFEEAAS